MVLGDIRGAANADGLGSAAKSSMTIITNTNTTTTRARLSRNISVLLSEIETTKCQPAVRSRRCHRRGGRDWLVKIMCGILIQAGLTVLLLSRPVVRLGRNFKKHDKSNGWLEQALNTLLVSTDLSPPEWPIKTTD